MMQRKVFYSVIQGDEIVGIKQQDGFELEIDGEKFNAYKSQRDSRVYILDPKNGIALGIYDNMDGIEDFLSETELIEMAKGKLIQSGKLKKWKELRDRESYQLTIQMFEAYKTAELLREKQKETAYREVKEREAAGQ